MITLCKLQRERAIEILLKAIVTEHIAYCQYRSGVWNKYNTEPLLKVIPHIRNSPYGADLFKDEKGTYYVSCPCQSDMW